jgi:hypothetical protein
MLAIRAVQNTPASAWTLLNLGSNLNYNLDSLSAKDLLLLVLIGEAMLIDLYEIYLLRMFEKRDESFETRPKEIL